MSDILRVQCTRLHAFASRDHVILLRKLFALSTIQYNCEVSGHASTRDARRETLNTANEGTSPSLSESVRHSHRRFHFTFTLFALLETVVLPWTQIAIRSDRGFWWGWVCFRNLKPLSERIAICVQGRTAGSSSANKGNVKWNR